MSERQDAEAIERGLDRIGLGATKYWLGVPIHGWAERIGWTLSLALGLARMVVLSMRVAVQGLLWLLLGLAINVAISILLAAAALAVLPSGEPFARNVALGMTATLFLSLLSMLRVGGPDVPTIALGAVPNRRGREFRRNLLDGVREIARSALSMTDDYRAAARYWYARHFGLAQLIGYVVVCIALFSAFMTSALAYVNGLTHFDAETFRQLGAVFLYYCQLGLDTAFLSSLDVVGIALSEARPVEPFALRLARLAIIVVYLARIAGYLFDVRRVDTRATRAELIRRLGLDGEGRAIRSAESSVDPAATLAHPAADPTPPTRLGP